MQHQSPQFDSPAAQAMDWQRRQAHLVSQVAVVERSTSLARSAFDANDSVRGGLDSMECRLRWSSLEDLGSLDGQ